MKLISVSRCPIDNSEGPVRFHAIEDCFFGTAGKWNYRENPSSGHLWLDPRPSNECIGELYQNYYTHSERATSVTSLWDRSVACAVSRRLGYPPSAKETLLARLLSWFPSVADSAELEYLKIPASQNGKLLDIGCGGGEILKRMQNVGWSVVGMEPDSNAASRLIEKDGLPIYRSLNEIANKNISFDVIVLSHVIEHLPDPVKTLAELRSLLRPNGQLIITTPNVRGLGSKIFRGYWRGLEPPRHFNVFSTTSLQKALTIAGFRVAQMNTEVRLARGIWYVSWLAMMRHRKIECGPRTGRVPLKVSGYLFQVFQAIIVRAFRSLGEEIFCVATASSKK